MSVVLSKGLRPRHVGIASVVCSGPTSVMAGAAAPLVAVGARASAGARILRLLALLALHQRDGGRDKADQEADDRELLHQTPPSMPAGRQGFVQILLHSQGTGDRGQGSTARSPPVILSPSSSLRTGSANLARRHDAPPLRAARFLASLGMTRSTPRPPPARLPGLFRYTRLVTGQPLALYVHIPFCTAKCTYCDFNSYAG